MHKRVKNPETKWKREILKKKQDAILSNEWIAIFKKKKCCYICMTEFLAPSITNRIQSLYLVFFVCIFTYCPNSQRGTIEVCSFAFSLPLENKKIALPTASFFFCKCFMRLIYMQAKTDCALFRDFVKLSS